MIRYRTAATIGWSLKARPAYYNAKDLVLNRHWDIAELSINVQPIPVLTDVVYLDEELDITAVSTQDLLEAQRQIEQQGEHDQLTKVLMDMQQVLEGHLISTDGLKQLDFINKVHYK